VWHLATATLVRKFMNRRLVVLYCVLVSAMGPVHANDMYSGVRSTPGTVQNFAVPVVIDASDPRLKHPLRRGTVVVKRVSITAVRPGAEPPLAGLRAEVPVYARIVEGGGPPSPISTAPKNVDFSVDLGMYNGRTRVTTPRYDPNGQITAADLDGDPATMRDSSTGRIRQVPQLSVGMNVRF
jgi:hypothetical protein